MTKYVSLHSRDDFSKDFIQEKVRNEMLLIIKNFYNECTNLRGYSYNVLKLMRNWLILTFPPFYGNLNKFNTLDFFKHILIEQAT